jgi:hypothetical protein
LRENSRNAQNIGAFNADAAPTRKPPVVFRGHDAFIGDGGLRRERRKIDNPDSSITLF